MDYHQQNVAHQQKIIYVTKDKKKWKEEVWGGGGSCKKLCYGFNHLFVAILAPQEINPQKAYKSHFFFITCTDR